MAKKAAMKGPKQAPKAGAYDEDDALKALDEIAKALPSVDAKSISGADLCKTYKKIKPMLTAALPLVKMIPVYGTKIALAIVFLMTCADQLCSPS